MRWKVIHVVEIFWYVAETRRSVMFPGSPSAWNVAGDIEYAQVKARVLRMDRVMVGWTYEKRRETYWLLHKQTEEKGPPCLSLPNWSNEHNLCFMMYLSSWCVRREAKRSIENPSRNRWMTVGSSIQSLLSWNCLDSQSATLLDLPGTWCAITKWSFWMHQFYSWSDASRSSGEWVLPLRLT